MSILKIKLTRNLRRDILRGHPWVYKEAIVAPRGVAKAQLCQVSDNKGDLAWAIFDPQGPLSLRILSTESSPPNLKFWSNKFYLAMKQRSGLRSAATDAFRLFNGEGDLLPGLVCDVYGHTAILQFDGQGPGEFWDRQLIIDWLLANADCKWVVEKSRRSAGEAALTLLAGENFDSNPIITENGAKFKVDLEKGQKTGFFLDQRDNRKFVRDLSRGKSVLNLFSYTGGFSVNAGLGQAQKVVSVDVAKGAVLCAEENWQLNELALSKHEGICADVFEFLEQSKEKWEMVLVDPPSMSHSEAQKEAACAKYVDLFVRSAKMVLPQGELSLSSCSSHISFEDFFEIITEALSRARRKGRILRIAGQGSDHPFPHACFELRYLKFVHLILD